MTTVEERIETMSAAAAISGEFHKNKQYEKFYKKYGEEMGGFPAIWMLCGGAAMALLFEAVEHSRLTGKNCEYIEMIDSMVENMFSHMYSSVYGAKAPTLADLKRYAQQAVQKSSE